jgi:hypothetical protein
MTEITISKQTAKNRQLAKEGRCPRCGEFSYPYYYCYKHRIYSNVQRTLRYFEKLGHVDVDRDPIDNKKRYKWKSGSKLSKKLREYSPETIATLRLPRMKGKPMNDKVIEDAIMKVLETKQFAMTEKEINKGIRDLKTIGKVLPETEDLLREYRLIKEKKSTLSKKQRDAVEFKVQFLYDRGVIQQMT